MLKKLTSRIENYWKQLVRGEALPKRKSGSRRAHMASLAATATIAALESRELLAGQGLTVTYYDNVDLTGATVSQVSSTVNLNWGTGSPDSRIAADTFSARWEGKVKGVEAGSYQFQTVSDDGVRLWINNQLVIDNWTNHTATTNTSANISLTAGQVVSLKMEYYDNTGSAQIKLSWKRPGQTTFAVVPEAQLIPTLSRPALIDWDAAHYSSSRASTIVSNLSLVKTRPFDGLAVSSYAGDFLMDPNETFVYDNASNDGYDIRDSNLNFGQLSTSTFSGSTLQHNFARINIHYPGSFFNDAVWTSVAQEFANFARVAKEKGFEGIVFDNEDYNSNPAQRLFDEANNTDPTKTSQQYVDKSQARGLQIMQAIVGQWADVKVIAPHGVGFLAGPDVSWDDVGDNMNAAFIVGMWQGRGASATVIDGGENGYEIEQWSGSGAINYGGVGVGFDPVYQNTRFNYPLAGEYSRTDVETIGGNPYQHYSVLPVMQQQAYSTTVPAGFMTYDVKTWSTNPVLRTAADTQTQNTLAMARADEYVLYYHERYDWHNPNGTAYPNNGGTSVAPPANVIEAIRVARETGNLRAPGTVRSNSTFEGGASGWTPNSGTWSVTSTTRSGSATQAYTKSGNTSLDISSVAGNNSAGGLSTATNYTAAGWVRIGSDSLSSFGEVGGAILGRYQDANNFYGVTLIDTGSGKQWEIFARENGNFRVIAIGNYSWTAGTWYQLRLKMNGSSLTAEASTNGTSFTTLGTATDYAFGSGKVGVMGWGSVVDFDNVTLTV